MEERILFLSSYLEEMSLDLYIKVLNEAARRNKKIIVFFGGPFHDWSGNKTNKSLIYNYINTGIISGAIINTGAIGQNSSGSFLKEFVTRFNSIPTVSLSYPIQNSVNVTVNNYQGIYDLIEHLIVDHGYKNIGFVKGPDGHPEAEERFQAYKDALEKYDIPLRDDLIAKGDFSEQAGIDAVIQFINSPIDVQAISCVDDDSALGVYSELKNRNIKCPSEVAVCGFDNIQIAEKLIPPLTTVAQPYDQMIVESFNILENKLTSDITVPTIGVRRESCGCRDEIIENAVVSEFFNQKVEESILILEKYDFSIEQKFITTLLNSLKDDLIEKKDYSFIDQLVIILEELDDISKIHEVLSVFHKNTPISPRSASIFQQSRLLVNKITSNSYSLEKINYENLMHDINTFISEMSQINNEDDLFDIMKKHLPHLGCEECHLVVLRREAANVVFSFSGGKLNTLSKETFDPREFLPGYILQSNKNYIVLPMEASLVTFGYAIYSIDSSYSNIYNAINIQIGANLTRIKLIQQRIDEKKEVELVNEKIKDLITPMLNSIKQVSDNTQNKIQQVGGLEELVDMNKKSFTKSLEMLRSMSEKIDNVMASVSVINDISENVNVLAINTSIQSAHAGEFGKAFGVIAKEIRKLSDSTAKNAKTITADLSDTIEEFKKFKSVNSENSSIFDDVNLQIRDFMNTFSSIAVSMDVLSSNSEAIVETMNAKEE